MRYSGRIDIRQILPCKGRTKPHRRYRSILIPIALLALASCGSRGQLKPAEGVALPVKPYAATATPTPDQLLTPSIQARPLRNDELLRSSEQRKADDFDLPPN